MAAVLLMLAGAAPAAPPAVRDLAWGETLFYYFQQDYIPAITRLGVARSRQELGYHADEADLVLGGLMLGYGLHRRAEAIFENLLATNPKREVRDQAWYFLAQVRFLKGFPGESLEALSRVEGRLPGPLQVERVDLEARALLASGRPRDAARVLSVADLPGGWRYYGWYNQGIALIRSGQPGEGDTVLERLAAADVAGPELSSLKDRANLSLGYLRLAADDPVGALRAFARVRLEGPYATRALLGAGWVNSSRGDYQAALIPWVELVARDPLDAAVQEALIAVPFAYAELGTPGRAVDRYEYAVDSYEGELRRLDRAIADVHSGRLIAGLDSERDDVAADRDPLSHYLYSLMAGDDFQRGCEALEDLEELDRLAERWQSSISAFQDMLAARRDRFRQSREPVLSALDEVRLAELDQRYDSLKASVDRAREQNDALMLADAGERESMRRTEALEAALGEDPATADRLRRLRGIVFWGANAAFPARLRAMDKSLAETRRALKSSSRHVREIGEADVRAPAGFAGFDARIMEAAGRLDSLRMGLRVATVAQTRQLENLAIAELQARRQRVEGYLSQARYALAASYDQAAIAGAIP